MISNKTVYPLGSQWEGYPLPAPPVCSEGSECGNPGVQLCIHSFLRFHCPTGTDCFLLSSLSSLFDYLKSFLCDLLSVLQDRWQELVGDIERGTVSSALALEPKVRTRLEALMKPDPERAAQLRVNFQDGFKGIAKRLWPHLHLVLAVDSGSNQIYGDMLRESYCQGLPFYSPFYAATEGKTPTRPWTRLWEQLLSMTKWESVLMGQGQENSA